MSVRVRKLANGTITMSGLSDDDARLLAACLEEASFASGDRGGDISRGLLRLAHAVRTPVMYGRGIGDIEVANDLGDPSSLYTEIMS